MNSPNGLSQEVIDLLASLRNHCCDIDNQIQHSITLSPVEFRVLSNRSIHYPVNATEFSDSIKISPSRTSRVIEKLEKNGYILVEKNSKDRRITMISITDKGIIAQKQIKNMREECRTNLENSLTKEEMLIFTKIGKKIINQM